MKKVIFAFAVIILLAAGPALASGGTPVVIGTAEPEMNLSTNVGWDRSPADGNWGGRGANGSFAVAWENDSPDVPDLFGRFAEVTIPGVHKLVPTRIEIGYLAGIANDDFCVLVSMATWKPSHKRPLTLPVFVAVGCINDPGNNTNETWTTTGATDLILPTNLFKEGQDVTVQIRVTGNAWSGFGTWGQLAIDYIKVWGVRK